MLRHTLSSQRCTGNQSVTTVQWSIKHNLFVQITSTGIHCKCTVLLTLNNLYITPCEMPLHYLSMWRHTKPDTNRNSFGVINVYRAQGKSRNIAIADRARLLCVCVFLSLIMVFLPHLNCRQTLLEPTIIIMQQLWFETPKINSL